MEIQANPIPSTLRRKYVSSSEEDELFLFLNSGEIPHLGYMPWAQRGTGDCVLHVSER